MRMALYECKNCYIEKDRTVHHWSRPEQNTLILRDLHISSDASPEYIISIFNPSKAATGSDILEKLENAVGGPPVVSVRSDVNDMRFGRSRQSWHARMPWQRSGTSSMTARSSQPDSRQLVQSLYTPQHQPPAHSTTAPAQHSSNTTHQHNSTAPHTAHGNYHEGPSSGLTGALALVAARDSDGRLLRSLS